MSLLFRPYGSQRFKAVIFSTALVLFTDRRRIVLVQLISKFPPLVENLLGLFRDSRQQNRAKYSSVSHKQCDLLDQQVPFGQVSALACGL